MSIDAIEVIIVILAGILILGAAWGMAQRHMANKDQAHERASLQRLLNEMRDKPD